MKKHVYLLMLGGMLSLSSCIMYRTHQITDNPIGTKKGEVKGKNLETGETGVAAAAKKGKITKIGSVDYKITMMGKVIVTVTGE
jgi:hypothetical protein